MSSLAQARRGASRNSEQGYILLALLLIIALMIIAAAAIVPSITFNIRRDREEEMIHRGVQYTRAIRTYYKKFGRYPTKLEDLESTNNLRFLRKRYKDPITGKDFKLLHFGDVQMALGGGIGGGIIPGASSANGTTPFGSQPGQPGGPAIGTGFANSGGLGAAQSSFGASSISNAAPGQNGTADSTGQPGDSTSSTAAPGGGQEHPGVTGQDQLGNTTFGGGPIVGVTSTSKTDTIREFNHKKKYSDWQFVYDPGTDRGGIPMTPNQPPIQGFGQTPQNLNGAVPAGSAGNGNSFGNSFSQPGSQNPGSQNPNSPMSGSQGTTSQPSNPPQQQ